MTKLAAQPRCIELASSQMLCCSHECSMLRSKFGETSQTVQSAC